VASPTLMGILRVSRTKLLGITIVAAGGAFIGAHRFAVKYRDRVGLPHPSPVDSSPADFGLPFETVHIQSEGAELVGWYVPAAAEHGMSGPRPAVAILHGWESNRGRTFAHVRYLHAAGFNCLVFDARGHGDNPPEELPISVPEFAADAAAAARWLLARPDVSCVGLLGHSMGGAGVIVAGADEPRVGAVVALSSPADPVSMTRKTFELGGMAVPAPIATPLAMYTAAVLLAPRRHSLEDASATAAAARYRGPLLLLHGAQDHGIPVEHLEIIARAAVAARDGDSLALQNPDAAPVETLVLPDYGHRWLYESADARRKVASFLAKSLGGPVSPHDAGERAAACVVERPADPVYGFGAQASRTPPISSKPGSAADWS
jgi:uncharacterized protein